MINASDAREDDEDYKNPVDLMFDKLAKKTRNISQFCNIPNIRWRRVL
jgi:hypothetical protein